MSESPISVLVSAAVRAGRRVDRVVRAMGPVNPVGAQNIKTGAFGTYRPVGASCPSSCPLLGKGCYAQAGNVALHQRKSSVALDASVRSVVLAAVQAARAGEPFRLHVSGDFMLGGRLDVDYLGAVVEIHKCVRHHILAGRLPRPMASGQWVHSWGYTACDPTEIGPWLEKLRRVGCIIRTSNVSGPWGTVIVGKGRQVAAREAAALGATYCPAQADASGETQCLDCRLCWSRDRLIAFEKH